MSLQQQSLPIGLETLPELRTRTENGHTHVTGDESTSKTVPSNSLSKEPAHDLPKVENEDGDSDMNHSNGENLNYPGPVALTLLLLGTCFATFLVPLDRTIVAAAVPRITDEFNLTGDIVWYGSAYLLTPCAFQPIYGRVFIHFDVRWSFLAALGLFELGSLVCGAAPTSNALIVGRAISGLGCAGVFAGCLIIVSLSVPLPKSPIYTALLGSM